ncbi:maleylpyruvate isomerase family mycothiol-dependent enzyme [Nocardioides stalactiti]|uniref:maleylpyruvate isomerase family mycothiol-dependent enzyme n=1 Tax=Nocardioides stalactiti TaxID=2755356 RepID=UPI0016012C6D|nr:maleylpyruvate isomerase family mycothiol-dependent enzyme [Nocardioides stalactiti]
MDKSDVWRHIHAERAALAATLAELTDEEWQEESLCTGWTVHDVAAHVISNPQIGWGDLVSMAMRNLGRSYNTMIFRDVKRRGAQETRESILADYAAYADSTRRVPVVATLDPLIDVLLHHQDIVRPVGRSRTMPPEAALLAADRLRQVSFLLGTRRLVRSVRMVADDIDWTRGEGPTVSGPIQELLMLCSGREPDRTLLSGDGLELTTRG